MGNNLSDQLTREYETLSKKENLTAEEKTALELILSKPTLEILYSIYKKYLYIQDTNRIDVVLAVALSRKLEGLPLWLFIVGPSGDGKTEQIKALDDGGITTKRLDNITSRTLIQGEKSRENDLMPQLKDKLILISDFAQFLKLHPDEKGQVWAQLRQLYDGEMFRATGLTGAPKGYKDIKTTMLVGTTPAIDSQILIFQELGTRELLYRTEEVLNCEELTEKVWNNENYESEMKQALNDVTLKYLSGREVKRVEITQKVKETLKDWTEYLRIMRASAETDCSTGELINLVYPEMPTRCLKQLKRLFICLKNLDDNYSDEKALQVIARVIESSITPLRKNVLMQVINNNPSISTSQVAQNLKVGKKTAYTHLNVLRALNLIDMEESLDQWGRVTERTWWVMKDNRIIKILSPKNKQGGLSEFS